jgi:hypothetical protein
LSSRAAVAMPRLRMVVSNKSKRFKSTLRIGKFALLVSLRSGAASGVKLARRELE